MGHIKPIWIIIEERQHGGFTVHTQIDTHGGHFPQHHNCIMYIDQNLQAYMQYYHLCNHCFNSINYRRGDYRYSEIMNGLFTEHQNGALEFPQIQIMRTCLYQFLWFVTRSRSTLHSHMCMDTRMKTAY